MDLKSLIHLEDEHPFQAPTLCNLVEVILFCINICGNYVDHTHLQKKNIVSTQK